MEAIQRYQTVEQESRKKHRQKMERQFKIVKPDASQDEVNAALDNSGQSNRIFEQAVSFPIPKLAPADQRLAAAQLQPLRGRAGRIQGSPRSTRRDCEDRTDHHRARSNV
jgi:hypothetical protein